MWISLIVPEISVPFKFLHAAADDYNSDDDPVITIARFFSSKKVELKLFIVMFNYELFFQMIISNKYSKK